MKELPISIRYITHTRSVHIRVNLFISLKQTSPYLIDFSCVHSFPTLLRARPSVSPPLLLHLRRRLLSPAPLPHSLLHLQNLPAVQQRNLPPVHEQNRLRVQHQCHNNRFDFVRYQWFQGSTRSLSFKIFFFCHCKSSLIAVLISRR